MEQQHNSMGTIPPSISKTDPEDEDDVERNVQTTEGITGEDDAPPEYVLDSGDCPWCEEGDFDNAHTHARMSHPDKYDELEG